MKLSTQNSIVKEIKSAVLHVNNFQSMTLWYSKILGIPAEVSDGSSPFYEIQMDNNVSLLLDDHRNMGEQKKHPICVMSTVDIDQAFSYAEENGIKIVLGVQRPHSRLAYFNISDCEGNIIMIMQSQWVNSKPLKLSNSNHPIKNHLNSIVFPVTDLKRATEWYSKLLGHSIKPEREDGRPIYWFDMANGTGILLDDNRYNQDFNTFPTFMLKATNIHQAYAFFREQGVKIVRDVQFDHYFIIEDPEGNAVMICL